MAGAVRDLWMPSLVAIALGASIIAGMVKLFNGSFISTPLAISVLWAIYNIIPPLLVRLELTCWAKACCRLSAKLHELSHGAAGRQSCCCSQCMGLGYSD